MDGENIGKPYEQMDWGVSTHYFRKQPNIPHMNPMSFNIPKWPGCLKMSTGSR